MENILYNNNNNFSCNILYIPSDAIMYLIINFIWIFYHFLLVSKKNGEFEFVQILSIFNKNNQNTFDRNYYNKMNFAIRKIFTN